MTGGIAFFARALILMLAVFAVAIWTVGFENLTSTAFAQQAPQSTNPVPAAQDSDKTTVNPPPSTLTGAQQARSYNPWLDESGIVYTTKHPWEIYLSVVTIALLVFMATLLVVFAWRTNAGFNSEFQRAFLLLTVIFAALYLIVAGYSDDQTAPVFSLLGAIVGYLFGRAPGVEPPIRETPERDGGKQASGTTETPEQMEARTRLERETSERLERERRLREIDQGRAQPGSPTPAGPANPAGGASGGGPANVVDDPKPPL